MSFLLAWFAVRMIPVFSAGSIDGIAVTFALTSTALGTLMPILHERSLVGTRLGDSILAYGTWGELGPVLAMSVLLSARSSVQTLMILAVFLVVCVVLAAVPTRSRRLGTASSALSRTVPIPRRRRSCALRSSSLSCSWPLRRSSISTSCLVPLLRALSCALSSPRAIIRSRANSRVWHMAF